VLYVVFVLALGLMVWRSRVKKRRRPATGADVLAAAQLGGEFSAYDVRPHRRDPEGGLRDWGQ
jgi:hypothetical protein